MYSVVKINCVDTDGNDCCFYIGNVFWFVSELDCAEKFEDDFLNVEVFEGYVNAYKEDIKRPLEAEGYKLKGFELCDVNITVRKEIKV